MLTLLTSLLSFQVAILTFSNPNKLNMMDIDLGRETEEGRSVFVRDDVKW